MSRMFRRCLLIALIVVTAEAQSIPSVDRATFRISGRVVDAVHGDPLPDIEVSVALERSETRLQSMTTGPDGRFEFAGLAPAKYPLTARGRGYPQQGYEQHHTFFTAIVTGPGQSSENLTFKLKPESTISGTVTDEFNDPVALAEALLFIVNPRENPQGITLARRDSTNDFGEFEFGHLPDAIYYVAVVAHPWYARNEPEDENEDAPREPGSSLEKANTEQAVAPGKHGQSRFDVAFQTAYYANATDPAQAAPIALQPGQHATVDLHLFAVPALHLKVRGSSASDAPDAVKLSEQIFSYSRQVASQGIGPDGTELNGLAPGRYLVEYAGQQTGKPLEQPLELFSDAEIVPGEGSKIASTVTGTIMLDAKEPCLRCMVRLINLPSWERFDAQNTDKGFQIEGGVRPGRYLVDVFKQEDYLIKQVAAVGASVVGSELEISAGANVRLSIGMTKDLGTINGVAMRNDVPASQVAVFLVPDDPARNRMLFRRDQSDSDGTFALRQVLPGDYTIVAVAEGWDLEWTNPAVLKNYLAGGIKIRVQAPNKYQVKVPVQSLEGVSK